MDRKKTLIFPRKSAVFGIWDVTENCWGMQNYFDEFQMIMITVALSDIIWLNYNHT